MMPRFGKGKPTFRPGVVSGKFQLMPEEAAELIPFLRQHAAPPAGTENLRRGLRYLADKIAHERARAGYVDK